MVFSTFFLGKLYMHPVGHESTASPSIQLKWEEEMLVEHSSLAKFFPFDYIIFWIIKKKFIDLCRWDSEGLDSMARIADLAILREWGATKPFVADPTCNSPPPSFNR